MLASKKKSITFAAKLETIKQKDYVLDTGISIKTGRRTLARH